MWLAVPPRVPGPNLLGALNMMSLVKIRQMAELAKHGPATLPVEPEPSAESSFASVGASRVHSSSSKAALVPVDSVFEVGRPVQAWSRAEKRWLPAEVLEIDAEDSMVRIKPIPTLDGAKPWTHPRGHAPYVDGFDRSSIRPMPKDDDRTEEDDTAPLGEQWSFYTNFEDIKATKDNDEHGWDKVRRLFAPDVILPGMKNENLGPEQILEHMFGIKYGPNFVKKEKLKPLTPGQRRAKGIIATAKANRQRSIERRM